MSWSLNEVEGLARKAARGSGLSWGLADEAGKATRWLMAANLPGADMLAGLLHQNDGKDYGALCPASTTDTWAATDGPLCPLITGAVICDHAATLADGKDITLGQTSFPMMLLPFAAGAAQLTGRSIRIAWADTEAAVGPDDALAFTNVTGALAEVVPDVRITATDAHAPAVSKPVLRCDIPEATAKTLGALAHRTYAPDTPESRLAGAGAGLTDND